MKLHELCKFLNPFVYKFFSCVCVKLPKTLSAKYYQEDKERLQQKAYEKN